MKLDTETILNSIERRAIRAKISMHALCKLTGISPDVWYRWRHRVTIPRLETLQRMDAYLTELGS